MKKVLSLILILSICFLSFSSNIFAAENENVVVPEENAYYNEEFDAYVVPFIINDNSDVVFLTEEEEKNMLAEKNIVEDENINSSNVLTSDNLVSQDANTIGPTPDDIIGGYIYKYDESGNSIVSKGSYKVSADMQGPGTITVTESITKSASFSISLSSGEKTAVEGSAGFTWVKSASSAVSYTMTIEDDSIAAVYFKPYFNKTWGTVKTINSLNQNVVESKSVTAYSPKKTANGYLDGLYYLVKQ